MRGWVEASLSSEGVERRMEVFLAAARSKAFAMRVFPGC